MKTKNNGIKKRSISFVLITFILICCLLSSCAKTENSQDLFEVSTNADITPTMTDVIEEKTGVLKIGGIGPLSGAVSIYGESVEYGANLAIKEINENGGINGYQVEFLMMDDMHDDYMSVSSYDSLRNWGMHFLMGPVTSSPAMAVAEKAAEDNMFMITPTASKDEIILVGDNVFTLCYTYSDKGGASAEYIAEHNIATNVAVIYDSSDSYSVGQKEKFVSVAMEKGLNVVATESYTVYTSNSFTSQLNACQTADADLIFIPINYNDAATLFRQSVSIDYSPIFFGTDALDSITYDDTIKNPLLEGVMFLYPFISSFDDAKTLEFVRNFKNFADVKFLNQFAADAYDAVYAIKMAAEKADISPQMEYSEICELMKTAFTQITMDGITGRNMKWNTDGSVIMDPNVVIIENAMMVPVN